MGFKIENTTPKKVGIVFTGITTSTALGVTTSVLLETSSAIAASAIVGGAAAGGMVLGKESDLPFSPNKLKILIRGRISVWSRCRSFIHTQKLF
jgi:hypothetical protein